MPIVSPAPSDRVTVVDPAGAVIVVFGSEVGGVRRVVVVAFVDLVTPAAFIPLLPLHATTASNAAIAAMSRKRV